MSSNSIWLRNECVNNVVATFPILHNALLNDTHELPGVWHRLSMTNNLKRNRGDNLQTEVWNIMPFMNSVIIAREDITINLPAAFMLL